jgi:hypothetical protein
MSKLSSQILGLLGKSIVRKIDHKDIFEIMKFRRNRDIENENRLRAGNT